jgi:histidinol-phosphate aminotransferase
MALAALGDMAFVEHSRLHNAEVRARFVAAVEALGNHGLRCVPSEANFVLVLCEGALSGKAAYEGLAQAGYMTRWFPVPCLDQGVRITLGTAEEMDGVAAVLRELTEAAK